MTRRPLAEILPDLSVSRRTVLVGAGAAGGLAIGWVLWPRAFAPNLVAAPGETILNAWLKIGTDGHVTVVVPQVEMGQGSYTLIPQIIADELGADWRTVGIEPAPQSPVYANMLFAKEWQDGIFAEPPLQLTGGSTTLRGFGDVARQAGAAARVLLCKAAAARWDADWRACETGGGFVTRGDDRLRFGELAEAAGQQTLPSEIPLRTDRDNRLRGRGLPRIDIPAKLDGSANYAGDIRLPDMLYASLRQGPIGDSRLIKVDKAAADKVAGVLMVVEHERWVAAIATNWWAANRALDVMRPQFKTSGPLANDAQIERALTGALEGDGAQIAKAGDADALLTGDRIINADYSVGLAPHAALEPMTATAAIEGDAMQLWIATQVPGLARAAAARAVGIAEEKVAVHAMLVGGSFGRKYEIGIAAQAAILARKAKRPVQLIWSRAEDLMHDRFRPPAKARLSAKLGAAGRIDAWRAKIAAPDGLSEMRARAVTGQTPAQAQNSRTSSFAVDGAAPPYSLAAFAVEHYGVNIGVPTGKWRSGAHSYTAFFNESFIDELARQSGIEPFSFRMAMLGSNPRLALCLSKTATKGAWEGGEPGTGQGIACHSMLGSHVAVLAEAQIGDDQRVRVTKLVCVADVGAVLNPDIARQQIEGGLLFGMAAAIGNRVAIKQGIAGPRRLGALGLPLMVDVPSLDVELIISNAPPGGVGEVAVPPVAPAIANALFAGSGRRFRSLPLAPALTS